MECGLTDNVLHKYLQYSKRIAIFGILQWSIIAMSALIFVLLAEHFNVVIDEWTSRVINNAVTCSSALAIAIASGYYAHSAYDNTLKQKVANAFNVTDEEVSSEGNG
jgi:hypothetical protein